MANVHKFQMGESRVKLGRMYKQNTGRPNSTCSKFYINKERIGTCEIEIDLDKLKYLCERAMSSKSGRAALAFGAIVCKRQKFHEHGLKLPDGVEESERRAIEQEQAAAC